MKRPHLVILDGYATNPGDISWAPIEQWADCTVYDRSDPSDVPARIEDADAVMLNKAVLDANSIDDAKNLKYVGILATGCNTVDHSAAAKKDITICNAPGYSTSTVAQHTFALLLALTNHVEQHAKDVTNGGWSKNPDYCYWLSPQVELAGKMMGLVGFGQIGQAVAKIALAHGMTVLAHRQNKAAATPDGVTFLDLDELLSCSDVLSLHCPLTEQTRELLNGERLQQMKPGSYLINTARGLLIDEQAVAEALRSGHLAGAGLDVLSSEPPSPDNPLLSAPNCLITPHLAWASAAARTRLIQIAADNLRAWLDGAPINQVHPA